MLIGDCSSDVCSSDLSGPRHPLHPALVHFPVACWSLATIADVASLWLGQPAWWLAGVLLVIGPIAALAAMGAGLFEFARIAEGSPALPYARRPLLPAMAACDRKGEGSEKMVYVSVNLDVP